MNQQFSENSYGLYNVEIEPNYFENIFKIFMRISVLPFNEMINNQYGNKIILENTIMFSYSENIHIANIQNNNNNTEHNYAYEISRRSFSSAISHNLT